MFVKCILNNVNYYKNQFICNKLCFYRRFLFENTFLSEEHLSISPPKYPYENTPSTLEFLVFSPEKIFTSTQIIALTFANSYKLVNKELGLCK